MIISHKYKCIFIRVPKCLSTSVEDFFIKLDPDCISSDNEVPYGHQTAKQVRQMVTEDEWNSYFKFTFFRNPEKRFINDQKKISDDKLVFLKVISNVIKSGMNIVGVSVPEKM